jgi:hypothetical protein
MITKIDLADAVELDWTAAQANIQALRPGMKALRVSSKTGEGLDEWERFPASGNVEAVFPRDRKHSSAPRASIHLCRIESDEEPSA